MGVRFSGVSIKRGSTVSVSCPCCVIQVSQHFHLLAYPEKGCHHPLDIYFQQQSFGFVQHYHMQALKAGAGQEAELLGKNVTYPESI